MNYIENQPVINIGLIGHVSNGKSTIVKGLSGIATQKHSKEKEQNVTIRLGYANAKIFVCPKCLSPEKYASAPSETTELFCEHCGEQMNLATHVSFVDCPGHNVFMATMLNGTAIMDYTILVESVVNPQLPAPQTREHIYATKNTPISIVCMNKIDLVERQVAEKNIDIFEAYLRSIGINNDVIPISGTLKCNFDVLCENITQLKVPDRKLDSEVKMIVVRSFNVNLPGTIINNLKGGVIGGSILQGTLKIGDDLIIYPGYFGKGKTKKWSYSPLAVKVISIHSDKTNLQSAIPGGLIGVQLDIDPAITSNDKLIGQIATISTNIMKVYEYIIILYSPLTELNRGRIFNIGEQVTINVNANNVACIVSGINEDHIELSLEKPICIDKNDTIVLSVKDRSGSTIMGTGKFIDGTESELNT